MKKIIYCFVALSFLLSGCSDNLSKGDAAELIKAYIEKEHRHPMYASFSWLIGYYKTYDLTSAQIKQLSSDGYLQGEQAQNFYFEIRAFTEKAKPFITTNDEKYSLRYLYLQIATVDKLVVNSIVCGKETEDSFGRTERLCEAQYEIKFKPNAPGEKLQLDSVQLDSSRNLTQTGKAHFSLKDKVWTTIGVYADQPAQ